MSGLDALFINPSDQKAVYQDLSADLTALEPPVWCRLLASYVKGKGYSADIWDMQIDSSLAALKDFIEVSDPRLVVVVVHGNQPSASTQTMPAAVALCKFLKQNFPDHPLLVVGGHPAALPERTFIETGADFICTGEGPTTIGKLLEYIDDNSKSPLEFNLNVPGLYFIGCKNSNAPVIMKTKPTLNLLDLNEMPGGCWDLLPMDKYRAHVWHCLQETARKLYASIYTSLGCSFACDFCMIQSQFRAGDALRLKGNANSYRMWPAEIIGNEIEALVEKYGVTNIKIADEMFWLNRNHVSRILDEILKRGYGDKMNFWFYSRVDTIGDDDTLLDKARLAGMKWAALGIEALSNEVRDGVDKANYGAADIFKTVDKLRSHGINVIGNYIFGLPGDTAESMQQTLDLALELNTEFANFYCAMPYPGSKLYADVAAKNPEHLPPSWLAYSQHSYETQPLPTATLSAAEVLEFSDDAFRAYFTNENYLAMIQRKFGDAAVEQIKAMAVRRLPRRLLDEKEFRCA